MYIEDGINKLTSELKCQFKLPENLYRWISIKIIEGEPKIISTIEKNFSISISNNQKIQSLKESILNDLSHKKISRQNFNDFILSSIMKQAEKICKLVCHFKKENYCRKR